MDAKEIFISVVDGQGGGIGKSIIARLRAVLQRHASVTICALGTNSAATANMLKAGADIGATGQNAIIQTSKKSDIILGPMAIVAANSMLGELTPGMALAISSSPALKILIPLNRCNLTVAIPLNDSTDSYIEYAVSKVKEYILSTSHSPG